MAGYCELSIFNFTIFILFLQVNIAVWQVKICEMLMS